MDELVLMSSVLRLSMVSLMPLLTELLSSQLVRFLGQSMALHYGPWRTVDKEAE